MDLLTDQEQGKISAGLKAALSRAGLVPPPAPPQPSPAAAPRPIAAGKVLLNRLGVGTWLSEQYVERGDGNAVVVELIPEGAAPSADLTLLDADDLQVGFQAVVDAAGTAPGITAYRKLLVVGVLTYVKARLVVAAGTWTVRVTPVRASSILGSRLAYLTVTIANGASLSGAANLNGLLLVGIIMPAAWTAANLTFRGSQDNATWNDVYSSAGVETQLTAAASRFITVDPTALAGVQYLSVRSGTSAGAVAQAADRSIVLVTRTAI